MKTLWESDGFCIGIGDKDNYVVYDHRKAIKVKDDKDDGKVRYEYSYHNNIASAVKEAARRTANEKTESGSRALLAWLNEYKLYVEEVTQAL